MFLWFLRITRTLFSTNKSKSSAQCQQEQDQHSCECNGKQFNKQFVLRIFFLASFFLGNCCHYQCTDRWNRADACDRSAYNNCRCKFQRINSESTCQLTISMVTSLRRCKNLTLPSAKTGGILASTTTALVNTLRYCNVLHSVHKLDYTVPVCPTVQFPVFMQTASAVLFLEYWCLHSYHDHEPRDIFDTPRYEYADFLPADSGSHSNCRSGCSDT